MAGTIKVLCVVPRGLAGRGGIETLFSHVKADLEKRPDAKLAIDFVASRGDASGAGWVLYFPIGLAAFTWKLLTRRYDVVHLNAATNASAWRKAVMEQVARLFRTPVVVHFHGSAFPKDGDTRPNWVPVLARLFRRADGIIVLGPYWREFVARFYAMPVESFDVVPNGVPDFAPHAPEPHDGPVHLLFAGNLTSAKGADTLLDALSKLPRNLPDWHATFAGTGDVDGFRTRATQAGLGERVTFTGWIEQERIKPIYRAADIVVLPSRGEVLPVCLIEGACAGAALVATPVGSVPDVVHEGENGFLVPVGDADALAARLADLIGDTGKRAAFRTASRQVYLKGFDLKTMIDGLVSVYSKVVRTR